MKIIRDQSPYLFYVYGYYYRSGNEIYAMKEVNKKRVFKAVIHDKGWIEYKIIVQPNKILEKGKEIKRNVGLISKDEIESLIGD